MKELVAKVYLKNGECVDAASVRKVVENTVTGDMSLIVEPLDNTSEFKHDEYSYSDIQMVRYVDYDDWTADRVREIKSQFDIMEESGCDTMSDASHEEMYG